jgi:hypothetical protein
VDDLDLARLAFLKDALTAQFTERTARWHAVQGGALAAIGLGLVGYLGGALARDAFLLLTFLAAGAVMFASRRLDRESRTYGQRVRAIVVGIETLKARRGG